MGFGSKGHSFNPDKDIKSLDGKVILVTGGNIGLGKQAALEFARHGAAQVWIAARNLDKAKVTADEINGQVTGSPVRLLQLDLASFDSVKKAAKTFSEASDRLDILMLNAGLMAAAPGVSQDGYEIQFGTNHMGHALLTKLLLPVLEKTAKTVPNADVRVVSLSSYGHTRTPKSGIVFDTLKTAGDSMGAFDRYGQSKLANILWVRQFAKRYPQFTIAAIHPGLVRTNLLENATGSPWLMTFLFKHGSFLGTPPERGVWNQLWASVSKDVESGEYYEPVGVGGKASAHGKDDDLAKKLWDWTEAELEPHAVEFNSTPTA